MLPCALSTAILCCLALYLLRFYAALRSICFDSMLPCAQSTAILSCPVLNLLQSCAALPSIYANICCPALSLLRSCAAVHSMYCDPVLPCPESTAILCCPTLYLLRSCAALPSIYCDHGPGMVVSWLYHYPNIPPGMVLLECRGTSVGVQGCGLK